MRVALVVPARVDRSDEHRVVPALLVRGDAKLRITPRAVFRRAKRHLPLPHHDEEVIADLTQQRPAGQAPVETPQSLVRARVPFQDPG